MPLKTQKDPDNLMMNRAARASNWVKSHIEHLAIDAHVVDVACGSGRHTSLLLSEGFRVTAVDRDISKVAELAKQTAFAQRLTVEEADLEAAPWPFDQRFDGIVVCNYLHRPCVSFADGRTKNSLRRSARNHCL